MSRTESHAFDAGCCKKPALWLTRCRVWLCIYAIGIVLWSFGTWWRSGYVQWLTNWTLLSILAYSICALLRSLNPLPAGHVGATWILSKLMYVLLSVATTASLGVVVLYWLTEFPTSDQTSSGISLALNIHVHGVGALLVWTDLFLSKMELRWSHSVFPLLFGAVYLAFNAIYTALFGHLYTILRWNNAAVSAGIVVAALLFVFLCFCAIKALTVLRNRVFGARNGGGAVAAAVTPNAMHDDNV
jgi:hypothetical protein